MDIAEQHLMRNATSTSFVHHLRGLWKSPRGTVLRIEALALVAIVLAFMLAAFGSCRRWSNRWIVQKGFLAANALFLSLGTYSIGLMQSSPVKSEMYPIWCVSFLTLFGCIDSITICNLDQKSQLWKMLYQLCLYCGYVLLMSISTISNDVGNISICLLSAITFIKGFHKSLALFLPSRQRNMLRMIENPMEHNFFRLYCDYRKKDNLDDYKYVVHWPLDEKEPNSDEVPWTWESNTNGVITIDMIWRCNWKVPSHAWRKKLHSNVRRCCGKLRYYICRCSLTRERHSTTNQCDNITRTGSSQHANYAYKDMCLSFSLCHLLQRRFFGLKYVVGGASAANGRSNNGSDGLVQFKWLLSERDGISGYDWAFKVIEVELAFLYDVFYTSNAFLHYYQAKAASIWACASIIGIIFVVVAAVVPGTRSSRRSSSATVIVDTTTADIIITLVILSFLTLLQVLQLVRCWTSNWARVAFACDFVTRNQHFQDSRHHAGASWWWILRARLVGALCRHRISEGRSRSRFLRTKQEESSCSQKNDNQTTRDEYNGTLEVEELEESNHGVTNRQRPSLSARLVPSLARRWISKASAWSWFRTKQESSCCEENGQEGQTEEDITAGTEWAHTQEWPSSDIENGCIEPWACSQEEEKEKKKNKKKKKKKKKEGEEEEEKKKKKKKKKKEGEEVEEEGNNLGVASWRLRLQAFLTRINWFDRYLWQSKLGQYSLVESISTRDCNKLVGAFFRWRISRMLGWQYIEQVFREMWGNNAGDVIELHADVKAAIARFLSKIEFNTVADWSSVVLATGVDKNWNYLRVNPRVPIADDYTYNILLWHIATCYCELALRDSMAACGDRKILRNYHVATALSKYCAYLFVSAPQLLPGQYMKTKSLYEAVVQDARLFMHGAKDKLQAMRRAEREHWYADGRPGSDAFLAGVRMGKYFEDMPVSQCWEELQDLWIAALVYAAPSESVEEHVRHLSMGGELITHLWAFLSHAGILKWETSGQSEWPASPPDDYCLV